MKKKSKLKPMDPATYSRLKRKAHCFDKEHPKLIDDLRQKLIKAGTDLGAERILTEDLKSRITQMIDPGLHEEAKKTSWSQGFHEGQKEAEERLRKENACFDKKHKFTEGKMLQNLNFGECLELYCQLLKDPSFGAMGRLTVLVPDGVAVKSITQDQMRSLLTGMVVEASKNSIFGNTKKGG